MDLEYHKKRTQSIIQNLDPFVKKANLQKFQKVEPYRSETNKAVKVVEDFIAEKGRIIYGGLAMNEFIKLKNKKDAIYEEDTIKLPDYDIYSPDPINDIIQISNKLFHMGFKDVRCLEAAHAGTYTIHLDPINSNLVDIHYVWTPHYHLIEKKKIGRFYYVAPEFMYIDIYKIYTDPLLAWDFRLEKMYTRGSLMEYYYPIQKPDSKFDVNIITPKNQEIIDILKYIINEYLINNNHIIITNAICYNFFIKKSNPELNVNIPHIELITNNIKTIYENILQILYKKYKKELITIKYFHPFFELFDNSIEIYYNNILIVKLYKNMNRCIPFIEVNTDSKSKDKIHLISFHGLLFHYYSYLFYYKYKKDHDKYKFTKHLIYNLIIGRELFLKKNNLIGNEKTIFRELIINCKYKTQEDRMLHQKIVKKRLEDRKPPVYSYKPGQKKTNNAPNFKFTNTSGNEMKQ